MPPPGLTVEYQDGRWTAYRLRPAGGRPDAGAVRWLAGGHAFVPGDLDALLVVL